jgi:hypothetical protein
MSAFTFIFRRIIIGLLKFNVVTCVSKSIAMSGGYE